MVFIYYQIIFLKSYIYLVDISPSTKIISVASVEIQVNGEVCESTSRMPFGNGWDYGIGFAVLEAHNGDHVYIRMLHNGEDVEHRDAKGKTSF